MTDSQNTTETSANKGLSNTLRLKDGWDMKKPTSTISQVLKEEIHPPQKKKEEILSHIKILEALYPKLFDRNNPKPLKIKIQEDILTIFK